MNKLKRIVYSVCWDKKCKQWVIRSSNEECVVGRYGTKSYAIADAKRMAKKWWFRLKKPSQLKIWKKNGKIQLEYTYGKDPVKYKG